MEILQDKSYSCYNLSHSSVNLQYKCSRCSTQAWSQDSGSRGRWIWVRSQFGVQKKFQDSLGYTAKFCLEKQKQNKNKTIYNIRTGKIAFYPVKILGSKPDSTPGTYMKREWTPRCPSTCTLLWTCPATHTVKDKEGMG